MTHNSDNPILQNWQAFSLADAYKPRPPIQYLAGNLFEIPSLNVIYGAPGSLKSFFLADLAICVASGNPWLPPYIKGSGDVLPVTKCPVVWLDFDNGVRRTHDRFSALGKALGLPTETPLTYYSMPIPIFDALSRDHVGQIGELIKERKARLVIIDNLGIISGGVDENSSAMIPVLANLRWLVESTGAVVNVIHHLRKSNRNSNGNGDDLRGHSSILSAVDLCLSIDCITDSNTITVRSTKERGAEISPFSATFTAKMIKIIN